ncbi:MAG: hypothetical protein AAB131_13190 [Actinomycetota bacterium]
MVADRQLVHRGVWEQNPAVFQLEIGALSTGLLTGSLPPGWNMDELRDDPEYEIRWPHDILAAQLDRLIARGRADGLDASWQDEVETVLRQAFASPVSQRDFQDRWNANSRQVIYGDEDPF